MKHTNVKCVTLMLCDVSISMQCVCKVFAVSLCVMPLTAAVSTASSTSPLMAENMARAGSGDKDSGSVNGGLVGGVVTALVVVSVVVVIAVVVLR